MEIRVVKLIDVITTFMIKNSSYFPVVKLLSSNMTKENKKLFLESYCGIGVLVAKHVALTNEYVLNNLEYKQLEKQIVESILYSYIYKSLGGEEIQKFNMLVENEFKTFR